MTVRRPEAYGNTNRPNGSASRRALLTLRTAVILLGGLIRSSPRATGPEGSNMPVSSGLVPATIQNVVM